MAKAIGLVVCGLSRSRKTLPFRRNVRLSKGQDVAGKTAECDLLAGFFDRSVVALELAAESREFMSSISAIALAIRDLTACLW